ncbi:uncharacterized protein LOC127258373 [Andrographis paniculata]|uniref:uncharacterized protein LOC127258373 n=1 Tax=Andrographis paniculata TaxID=175694 RepID=UPI0021E8BA78|nr:uncharacterized protein LOC127258373 [Andrographis paniculata]
MADGNPTDAHQRLSLPADSAGNGVDNVDDGDNATSSSSAVAEGLYSLISSVMNDFDSRAEAAERSQDQLEFTLDRLTGELDKLLEDAPTPFIIQHAAKISSVRKRVKVLNTVLKSVQHRIDNLDQMLSTGSVHENIAAENSGQQQA